MSVRVTESEQYDIKSAALRATKVEDYKDGMEKQMQNLLLDLHMLQRNHVIGMVEDASSDLKMMKRISCANEWRVWAKLPEGAIEFIEGIEGGITGNWINKYQPDMRMVNVSTTDVSRKVDAPAWLNVGSVYFDPEAMEQTEELTDLCEMISNGFTAWARAKAAYDKAYGLVYQTLAGCDTVKQMTDAFPGIEKFFPYTVTKKVRAYEERLAERRRQRALEAGIATDDDTQSMLDQLESLTEESETFAQLTGGGS